MESYVNPAQRISGVDREQQMWTYRHAGQSPAGEYVRPAAARKEPPLVEDVVASVFSERKVVLTWKPPSGPAPAGYHVERAAVEVFWEDQLHRLRTDTEPLPQPSVGGIHSVGAFERLTSKPLAQPRFEDVTVDLTRPVEIQKPTFLHRFSKEQVNADGKKYRHAVYAYRVRAVNSGGLVGGPSPYVLT